MEPKKLDFHVASRKPFAGEAPVIEAVKRAQQGLVSIKGRVEGGALFRVQSSALANPTVIPQAVDIVRGVAERAVAAQSSVVHEALVRETGINLAAKQVQSGIDDAHAKIAASLARLNA